jgi:hypothetical protein
LQKWFYSVYCFDCFLFSEFATLRMTLYFSVFRWTSNEFWYAQTLPKIGRWFDIVFFSTGSGCWDSIAQESNQSSSDVITTLIG